MTHRFVGAIVASGAARGANSYGGNLQWLLIVWLQLLFSGLILVFVLFIPESPRWLFVNNKFESAKAMLVKYHGEGNPDSVWVQMQLKEYEEVLEMDGADKRWWDYRALFNNRSARYRLMCNCVISIFGQFAGNCTSSFPFPFPFLVNTTTNR
jgi:hypothetical protein